MARDMVTPEVSGFAARQQGEQEQRADDGGAELEGDHLLRRTGTSTENNLKPSNPASMVMRR